MYVVTLLLVFCSEIDVISYAMSRKWEISAKYEISMLVLNWSYIHALL
jgi:hypothetical protein